MPKDCPMGKKGSHACFECIFNECLQCTYNLKHKDVVKRQIENTSCLKCIHFSVCARHMGGMNLTLCEDYNESCRNKGKWLFNKYAGQEYYKCSCCGKDYPLPPTWNAYDVKKYLKYCSACGVEMQED